MAFLYPHSTVSKAGLRCLLDPPLGRVPPPASFRHRGASPDSRHVSDATWWGHSLTKVRAACDAEGGVGLTASRDRSRGAGAACSRTRWTTVQAGMPCTTSCCSAAWRRGTPLAGASPLSGERAPAFPLFARATSCWTRPGGYTSSWCNRGGWQGRARSWRSTPFPPPARRETSCSRGDKRSA